jgi:hypothetical protein
MELRWRMSLPAFALVAEIARGCRVGAIMFFATPYFGKYIICPFELFSCLLRI